MLDQNSDRLWYVIGVALVSIFVFLFVQDVFPGVFAGAMDGSTEATIEYVEPEPGVTSVKIPYEIDYTMDPTKVREGVHGLKNVFDNGDPEVIVKNPVNRIALYPYEPVEVAFTTRYVDNPDQPQGFSKVVQKGVVGTKTYFHDPHTNAQMSEYKALYKAPKEEIIERGTAPISSIAFKTVYTLDSTQVRAGKNGEKYTDSKGQDHVIKAAIDAVVLYLTREEVIPFQTVRRENRDLLQGKENVIQNGTVGNKTIHYHPDTDKVMKEVVTKQPIEKIVEYGTMQTATISYKTEYTMNDSSVRSGTNGQKNVYSNGSEKVTKQPVNEIKKYPYNTRSIAFDTRYTENPDLYKYKDEQVVAKAGQYGQNYEYFDPTTNKVVQTVVVKAPVTKQVHTGWIPLNRSTHLVKAGDALYGLANHYNTSISTLQSWNRLGSSTHIEIGWRLIIN